MYGLDEIIVLLAIPAAMVVDHDERDTLVQFHHELFCHVERKVGQACLEVEGRTTKEDGIDIGIQDKLHGFLHDGTLDIGSIHEMLVSMRETGHDDMA